MFKPTRFLRSRAFLFKRVPGTFLLGLFIFPPTLAAKIIEQVVAIVNNDVITRYDLDRAMAPMLAEGQRPLRSPEALATLRKEVLENLVHQKLLEAEIAKAAIEVTDSDLLRTIAGILQKNGITSDQLRAELSTKGISFEAYKEQLKGQIRQAKFIQQNLAAQVHVTSQDIQNYRRQHQLVPDIPQKVRLAWIYLALDPDADEKEKKVLLRKGRELAERGRKGEDFLRLIQKYSEAPKDSANPQRVVGTNELPGELVLAIQRLEPEAITDPVVTPQGVYVVQLLERWGEAPKDQPEPNEEAIWQFLFNEKLDQEIHNYVLRLRKKAYVEIKGD